MESLALLASLIVVPALIGGPLALALTLAKGRWARVTVIALAFIALPSSAYLAFAGISTGATTIGAFGLLSATAAAFITLRKKRP